MSVGWWQRLIGEELAAATPREGLLATRGGLAQVVDGWIAAGGTAPRDVLGLPAVAGARRLIASTIDQLPLVVDGADVPLWLRSPRAYGGQLDQGDLIQHAVDGMILHGRACWRVTCTGDGGTSWQLDALDPQFVQAVRRTDAIVGRTFLVAGVELPEVPVSLATAVRGRSYLLHIPYLVTVECPEGTTPLTEAQTALRGFVLTEQRVAAMFDEGASHTGGVLSTAHDITVSQATQWQEAWITARRTRKIPVLGNGLEYRNEAPNSRDLQLVEARQFNQSAVWALLGIPQAYMGSSLMGGQSSLNYANAQDNRRQFADNCLRAFTTQIEDAVSRLLPPGRNPAEQVRARFDYTEWEGRVDSEPSADVVPDPG